MAILITGGTKGIGLDIAKAFAEPGATVFLNYHADETAAQRASQTIAALGAQVHLLRADVGTPEGCAAMAAEVRRHADRLDQVVHCAVDALGGPTLNADLQRFTRAAVTNGLSLLYVVQSLLPLLVRGSTVCFLSSSGGRRVIDNYAAIGIGKAMSESLLRYLAAELAPRGVRINAVAPSIVETDAVRALFGDNVQRMMTHSANGPSGRAVQPRDYTSLIRFLASPEAEYITGQVVSVNGGANLSA